MAECSAVSWWIEEALARLIKIAGKNRSGYSAEHILYLLVELFVRNRIGDQVSRDWEKNPAQNPPHKEAADILGLEKNCHSRLAKAFGKCYSKEGYERLVENSQKYAENTKEILDLLGLDMPPITPAGLHPFFVEVYRRLRPPSAWVDPPPSF